MTGQVYKFWRDRMFNALVGFAVVTVLAIPAWIAISLLLEAWPRLDWAFLSQLPERSGRSGGISSILVSTLIILLTAMTVTVPLGIGTAIFLRDTRAPIASLLKRGLDTLSALPSIVIGLFGLIVFGDRLGLGYSLACGGLSLACMLLPLFIRLGESALAAVPPEQIQQARALGFSRWSQLRRVELAFAYPGLLTALMLCAGRGLAETAVLIFTAGSSDRMPSSLLDPGRSLSVHIYELAMNIAGGDASAAATALVLMVGWSLIQWPVAIYASRHSATENFS